MEQGESRGRWRHAAALPLEEGRAQLLLHIADALARRSEGEPAARRTMRDAGGIGDVQDQPQVDQVEAHLPSPSSNSWERGSPEPLMRCGRPKTQRLRRA